MKAKIVRELVSFHYSLNEHCLRNVVTQVFVGRCKKFKIHGYVLYLEL